MSIKKFSKLINESSEDNDVKDIKKVYIILIKEKVDDTEIISEDKILCFDRYFDAADYLINWVNDKYKTNYEPMAEDGNRLFITVDENLDYKKAREKANGLIKIRATELK